MTLLERQCGLAQLSSTPNAVSNYVEATGISSFSWITVSDNMNPLPVTWLSFEGKRIGREAIQLQWMTDYWPDADYFDVGHSINGTQFTKIGKKTGCLHAKPFLSMASRIAYSRVELLPTAAIRQKRGIYRFAGDCRGWLTFVAPTRARFSCGVRMAGLGASATHTSVITKNADGDLETRTFAANVWDGDNQTISLSGTTLSILDGNSVNLSSINTDAQTISLSGTNLSILNGNTLSLASLADNLGNHTATQNLHLGSFGCVETVAMKAFS